MRAYVSHNATVVLLLRSFREINIYEERCFRVRSVITPIALGRRAEFLGISVEIATFSSVIKSDVISRNAETIK